MLKHLVRVDDIEVSVGKVQLVDVAHLEREIGGLLGLLGEGYLDDGVGDVDADDRPTAILRRKWGRRNAAEFSAVLQR